MAFKILRSSISLVPLLISVNATLSLWSVPRLILAQEARYVRERFDYWGVGHKSIYKANDLVAITMFYYISLVHVLDLFALSQQGQGNSLAVTRKG